MIEVFIDELDILHTDISPQPQGCDSSITRPTEISRALIQTQLPG